MSQQHEGLPVKGYKAQSENNVELVNINKATEERILRMLDMMDEATTADKRWLAIARTHIEQGFMALNRAVFQPERITLPEDE